MFKTYYKNAKLEMNRRGQAGIVAAIVALLIAVIMSASVLLPQIINTNTSTWGTSEIALWAILPLAAVVGLLVMVFRGYGLI